MYLDNIHVFICARSNHYHVMLVDKDVEASLWIRDDVFESLEDGKRTVLHLFENRLEDDDVFKSIALLQNVDLIQNDVRVLM